MSRPCRRGCCKGRSNPGYKWLICGTGYSGTKWAATVLTKLGFRTEHESPLTYNGWMSTPVKQTAGVSSAYALPRHVDDTAQSLLIVRHPARWYATVTATRLFAQNSDHMWWIGRHWPDDPVAFWRTYNQTMMGHADQTVTLEEITSDPEHAAGVFANLVRGRIDPRHVADVMKDVGVVNTHYEPMREAEELWATI